MADHTFMYGATNVLQYMGLVLRGTCVRFPQAVPCVNYLFIKPDVFITLCTIDRSIKRLND